MSAVRPPLFQGTFYEKGARRGAVSPLDSPRPAKKRVVAGGDAGEAKPFEDRDALAEEGVVRPVVRASEALDAEAVDPDEAEALRDEELRAGRGEIGVFRIE